MDIECFENKIVKEERIYKNRQNVGFSFLPLKNLKLYLSLLGVRSIFMEPFGTVAKKHTEFEKILKNQKLHKRSFLQKVIKNLIFVLKFWKQRLQIWMTTHF